MFILQFVLSTWHIAKEFINIYKFKKKWLRSFLSFKDAENQYYSSLELKMS